jgi:hypothetical protein
MYARAGYGTEGASRRRNTTAKHNRFVVPNEETPFCVAEETERLKKLQKK